MNGHTCHLTTGIQPRDNLVIALAVYCNGLPVNVCGYATHHVMAGRYHRDGLFDRVNVSEGSTKLTNTGQSRLEDLFTQVIELEFYVITLFSAAAPFENF